jgi:hypothetical protein
MERVPGKCRAGDPGAIIAQKQQEATVAIDRTFIQTLAEANGLTIPDERLDLVLRQYESYLRALETIDSVDQKRELEPVIDFSVDEATQRPPMPGGPISPGMMQPDIIRRRIEQRLQQQRRR